MGHYIRTLNNIWTVSKNASLQPMQPAFLPGIYFMSHAKVITVKVILRKPFAQWVKAPQLSGSLNETRMCPQISIVSTSF